jgi:hypothetical protein
VSIQGELRKQLRANPNGLSDKTGTLEVWATGRNSSRYNLRPIMHGLCKSCGESFAFLGGGNHRGLFCSKVCANKYRRLSKEERRLKQIWQQMHYRCNAPLHSSYPRYGGRGITVAAEWEDFDAFFKWSLRNGYKDDLTIDRVNNDEGYSPVNCRWATRSQQQRNRADRLGFTAFGETKLLCEWAAKFNLPVTVLYNRARIYGWEPERALTTPVRHCVA